MLALLSYMGWRWRSTGTLPAQNSDNFLRMGIPVTSIQSSRKASLASFKWYHTFNDLPMFLTNVMMPGAWGKLRGSSINFPSTEVSLNKGPRRDLFFGWISSSPTPSCLPYTVLCTGEKQLLSLPPSRMRQRRSGCGRGIDIDPRDVVEGVGSDVEGMGAEPV